MPPFRPAVMLLAAAALLSACGGGGGGSAMSDSGSGPDPGSTTGGRCAGTAIFGCLAANQWGLGRIGAESAWRRISQNAGRTTAPGAGQTVGVIDSGIDTGHPAFCQGSSSCSKTVTEEFFDGATDETGAIASHGTAVASVIVGRLLDASGVAWGADVAMFAIPLGSGGGDYRPVSLGGLAGEDTGFEAVIDRVLAWSSGTRTIDFVNLSLGIKGVVDMYSAADLRTSYGDSIAAFAQSGVTDKTVFVWAAGNGHGKSCDRADFPRNPDLCESYVEHGRTRYRVNARSVEILSGLPVHIPELRGHAISVVAVGRNGRIAPFSNRCGSAAQWCLAAPGVDVRAAYFGPDPETDEAGVRGSAGFSGTSAAAPMVTGALVVMKHFFRDQMSNTDLVTRMMLTARKTGIYADSAIYGQGLLDLNAATTPVGTSSLALGKTVNGPVSPVTQARFDLGNAFGNALSLSFAGQDIAAFDEAGAPFWYGMDGFARVAPRPSALARLDAFMAPSGADRELRTGMRTDRPPLLGGFVPAPGAVRRTGMRFGYLDAPVPGLGGGHLSLAGRAMAFDADGPGDLGFAVFSTEGMRGRAPVSGALLSWQPSPNRPGDGTGAPAGPSLRLEAGWMVERKTMLGSRSAGAFGRLSTAAAFVGLGGGMQVGGWRLNASAELGMANAKAGGGMLTGVSPLYSSAFALRAERALNANSSLRVSISQPLRVETGRARLSVPVGRTKEGRVLRQALTASLAPDGRQIDLAARWRKRLDTGSELRLRATWTFHPAHDAATTSELAVLAGWRRSF